MLGVLNMNEALLIVFGDSKVNNIVPSEFFMHILPPLVADMPL
jgi:hypothetical protein